MSEFEIVKSEYNALGEDNNYKTHYLKTSADQVVGLGRMKSFSYAVGNVVYTDSNLSVALKCTTSGTTSNTELDISNKVVGNSVTDGSVVWEVVSRDVRYKTFTTFEELKLTGTPTLTQILEAMPSQSKFVRYIGTTIASNVGVPDGGVLEIAKGQYTDYAALQHQRYGGNGYVRKMWYENWERGQTEFSWKKVLDDNDYATRSEAKEGIVNNKAITPSTLKDAIDARNFAQKGALSMPYIGQAGIAVDVNTLSNTGYVAPCDGWLMVAFTSSATTNNWCRLYDTSRNALSMAGEAQTNHTCRLFLPTAKGSTTKASFGNSLTLDNAYFYIAQSEV